MPPRPPWTARWEGRAQLDSTATMVLEAPDLPADAPLTFSLEQVGAGVVATVQQRSAAGGCRVQWRDWFHPQTIRHRVRLRVGQSFDPVRFRFEVSGAGRRVTSAPLAYADTLDAELVDARDQTPLANADFRVLSPWGRLAGRTNAEGRTRIEGLPPGGVRLVIGKELQTS